MDSTVCRNTISLDVNRVTLYLNHMKVTIMGQFNKEQTQNPTNNWSNNKQ